MVQAENFAKRKHKGQLRLITREPYFVHPDRVAKLVVDYRMEEGLIALAYLHVVLEDTDTSREEILN